MKSKIDPKWLINQSNKFSSPVYLGNFHVIDTLVRLFISNAFQCKDMQRVYKKATGLSNVLLGLSEHYPGPKWNSIGQINQHLAKRFNISEKDPKKIVTASLIGLLLDVIISKNEEVANSKVNEYVNILTGIQ